MFISGLCVSLSLGSGPDGNPHAGASFPYRSWKTPSDFRLPRRRSNLSCHHTIIFAIGGNRSFVKCHSPALLSVCQYLVIRIPGQQRPENTGMLSRQCHRSLVEAAALLQCQHPPAPGVVVPRQVAHHRACPMNQQGTQIDVASLGNPPMARLATRGVLPRNQSQPGRKLAPILEQPSITNGRHQGRGRQGAHAWYLHQSLRRRHLSRQAGNASVIFANMRFEYPQALIQIGKDLAGKRRQGVVSILSRNRVSGKPGAVQRFS